MNGGGGGGGACAEDQNLARGSGGALQAPPAGSGAELSCQPISCSLEPFCGFSCILSQQIQGTVAMIITGIHENNNKAKYLHSLHS